MASPDGIADRRHTADARQSDRPYRPGRRDVHLVCYPRSGSTWVRAVVAEAMFGGSGETLEDLDHYCPDIHARTPASRIQPAPFHLVKSHWPMAPQYRSDQYARVVYLLRDPRDVVLSHFRYLTGLGRYGGGFEEFLADWLYGRVYPCSWAEHVLSWLAPAGAPRDCSILRVRYEDLTADPAGGFARLLEFLDLNCGPERLTEILRSSSPECLRRKERRGMRPSLQAENLEFIGPARAGRWRKELSDRQVACISDFAGPAMKIAGYL